MSESQRTIAFVVVAAVSLVLARFAGPAAPKPISEITEVGEWFFPDFKDADSAKSLEVVSYNSDIGSIRRFGVVQDKDGRWRIPYAHNYPADGKEQLAKTATSMIGIKKEGFAGRREAEHAEFGVLDPNAESTTDFKGVGNRITLKDANGKVLADYIIGKDVKGQAGYRYVRRPDQSATYRAKVDIQVTTKFVDWIEPDLLKIDGTRLNAIDIDTTSVVEGEQRQVVEGELSHLTRATSSDPWKIDGIDESKEEVNQDEVRKIVTSLDDLKIVGVRRKPPRLMQSLREGEMQLDQMSMLDLDSKGFMLARSRNGKAMLFPKEGNVIASTDQGVRYDLKFGEIFNGTDEEVEVGFAAKEEGKEKEGGEKKEAPKSTQKSRYLFVTVTFDPKALGPKPNAPTKPEPPAEGSDVAATEGDEPADALAPTNTAIDPKKAYEIALAKYEADRNRYEGELKSYDEKIKSGEKLVKSLNARFADWYYVVSGNSFENLRQGRKTLLKDKTQADATKTGGAADSATDGASQK